MPDLRYPYSSVQAAVDAAAKLNPSSEDTRVSIHIAPGTYREQVRVNTPYISFINDTPSQEVKITWYYGIGYKYYSMGSDGYYNAANASAKSAKGEATRWGSAVALRNKAAYFRAEYITFEDKREQQCGWFNDNSACGQRLCESECSCNGQS